MSKVVELLARLSQSSVDIYVEDVPLCLFHDSRSREGNPRDQFKVCVFGPDSTIENLKSCSFVLDGRRGRDSTRT
jgi:hypothetical protein